MLKRFIELLTKKVFYKRGKTEASEWQTIIRKSTRLLERAFEICDTVLSQKSALISGVVCPFFYLVIRHNLRNELLMENFPHRSFENIHHNVRTSGGSYLQQREPRARGGPVGHLRIYPKLRLLPPRSDGGAKFFRSDDSFVCNQLTPPTTKRAGTARCAHQSNGRPAAVPLISTTAVCSSNFERKPPQAGNDCPI